MVPLDKAPRPVHTQDSLPTYLAAKHAPGTQQKSTQSAVSVSAVEPASAHGKAAALLGRMGRERRESTTSDASDDQWLTDAMVEEGGQHARPHAKHNHGSHEGRKTCIGVCYIDWRQVGLTAGSM